MIRHFIYVCYFNKYDYTRTAKLPGDMICMNLWLSVCVTLFCHLVRADDDVIRGTYHAWWVILPLPIDVVRSMVRYTNTLRDLELVKPPWHAWPIDKHPVVMEIGRELDCGPIFPKWLRSNFLEYKFDIPFVQRATDLEPLNYKVALYEDSEINSESSKFVYKLNATKATMKMTNTSYTISRNAAQFSALFSSNITWYSASSMPEFQVYEDVAKLKWFGGNGPHTCAKHNYDFGSTKIRPASVLNMTFTPDLLNSFFPEYVFKTNPLSGIEFFGSVEVMANFTMSLPHSCSPRQQ